MNPTVTSTKFTHSLGPGPTGGPSSGTRAAVAARSTLAPLAVPNTPPPIEATPPLITTPDLSNLNLAPGKRLKRTFAQLST